MEQKIAQDIADFRELREKGFVYVDKTEPAETVWQVAHAFHFGVHLPR